jgi:hypothetical protein
MKHRSLFWIVLIAAELFLAGCTDSAEPTPTPPPITLAVDVTPSTRSVIPALNRCAAEIEGLKLIIEERYPEFSEGDLLVRLGEPAQMAGFAAQIGQEQLTVLINPQNTTGSLTTDDIQGLFSGQITNWAQLGGPDAAVSVWVPLAGDETRAGFDSQIMDGLPIVSDARLAPDPTAMMQAVSTDPYAIGYTSASNMTFSSLQPILPGVRLPVLVLADREPVGETAELIACLQSGSGQETLSGIYP